MAYSETKVIIGGLAHVPILIFIANLIKGKFEHNALDTKEIKVKKGWQHLRLPQTAG